MNRKDLYFGGVSSSYIRRTNGKFIHICQEYYNCRRDPATAQHEPGYADKAAGYREFAASYAPTAIRAHGNTFNRIAPQVLWSDPDRLQFCGNSIYAATEAVKWDGNY